MADMTDDIAHLSQEIGARPAGTEEEQQAALYIADELQKSAGFSTIVEDVSCASNGNTIRLITFIVAFVCTFLAIVIPVLSIPCVVIGLLNAAQFICEALGKPLLSRFLRNGVSQNVVAKYNPVSIANAPKRRKVILVTHYDSAHAAVEHQGFIGRYLPQIRIATALSLIIAPLFLLIKVIFFGGDTSGISAVITAIEVICLVLMALPIAGTIKDHFAPYNEAANNDAAGVAVLLDVARTVGNGLVSAEEMASRAQEKGVEIHGEEAAYEAGVVPEGVKVTYQTREEQLSPEESLAAAKAAIAALTGKPVADKVPVSDISSKLVHHGGFADNEEEAAAAAVHFEVEDPTEKPAYQPSNVESGFQPVEWQKTPETDQEQPQKSAPIQAEPENADETSFTRSAIEALQPGETGMASAKSTKVPSWAKAAQEKAHANKPELSEARNVSRSRFADAPAAQIAAASMNRSSAAHNYSSLINQGNAEAVSTEPESELAKRAAVLRQEIDSAATPYMKKPEPAAQNTEIVEEQVQEPAAQAQQEASPVKDQHEMQAVQQPVNQPVQNIEQQPTEFIAPVQQDAGTTPQITEETLEQDPVVVPIIEPIRQSPVELIEEDAHASVQESSRKRPSVRRSSSTAANNHAGGFLGRASSMVSSVSSKVSNFKDQHLHHEEPQIAEEEYAALFDNYTEEFTEDNAGQTVSMPQIDVTKINDYEQPEAEEVFTEGEALEFVENVQEEAIATEIKEASSASVQLDEEKQHAEEQEPKEYVEPVAPIVGMEEMTSVLPVVQQEVEETPDNQPDRHVIVLPDVVAPVANNMEAAKQRAPMAADAEGAPQSSPLLSNMLPRIDSNPTGSIPAVAGANNHGVAGLDLPDFSTSDFERVDASSLAPSELATGEIPVQGAGSAGSTGSFAMVTADLVDENLDEADYVEDADDSVFEEGFTQSGAFAGPDYVEMPQSRVGRLFGRFGKKKNQQEEPTIREWVDVDGSYEAASVGKERGSWKSFRNEDEPEFVDVDFDSGFEDDEYGWKGGAFSLQSLRNRVTGDPAQSAGQDANAYSDQNASMQQAVHRDVSQDAKIAEEINNEMRAMRDFHHPDIDTEVWFVALGAEEAYNSGMKAFIEEHKDELQGAIIVNLEGLGAGRLSFISEEGEYRPNKVSSRLKRMLRQASERSGVPFQTAKLLTRNTAAHIAAQSGLQAMTLAGMDGNQTAYYASMDDRLENIEPETLKENSRFVLELLKTV